MRYWPHQDRIHALCRITFSRIAKSNRAKGIDAKPSFCVVAPCGAGKTAMMMRIAENAVSKGKAVAIYSCRIQNTKQLLDKVREAGLEHGAIAAAFQRRKDLFAPVQVCQMQTVARRSGALPEADIVLVDEAHQQASGKSREILMLHKKNGSAVIGFTGTPLGLGDDLYDEILEDVFHPELLSSKAHLPCRTFCPEVPAAVARRESGVLKIQSNGDLSVECDRLINRVDSVFGNVIREWRRLNPRQLPSVLFAPDVGSSVGYVERFRREGVRCASIDGERVVMCREDLSGLDEFDSTLDARQTVLDGSRDGTFKVVCNRFILREAVDMPWLFSGILCSTMTGLSTYLQSTGRILRYWPAYENVVIQDHSGSTDLHGFCHEQQQWELGDTNRTMAKKTRQRREQGESGDGQVQCRCGAMRQSLTKCNQCGFEPKKDDEPIVCPKCGESRSGGKKCYGCGHLHSRSVRMIREIDGTLTERKVGRITKRKQPKDFDYYLRKSLYACKNKSNGIASVKQAYKLAEKKARAYGVQRIVAKTVSLPNNEADWKRTVKDFYKDKRI